MILDVYYDCLLLIIFITSKFLLKISILIFIIKIVGAICAIDLFNLSNILGQKGVMMMFKLIISMQEHRG